MLSSAGQVCGKFLRNGVSIRHKQLNNISSTKTWIPWHQLFSVTVSFVLKGECEIKKCITISWTTVKNVVVGRPYNMRQNYVTFGIFLFREVFVVTRAAKFTIFHVLSGFSSSSACSTVYVAFIYQRENPTICMFTFGTHSRCLAHVHLCESIYIETNFHCISQCFRWCQSIVITNAFIPTLHLYACMWIHEYIYICTCACVFSCIHE